jgi:hypothetical protein
MPNVSHMLTVATLATGIGVDGSLDAVRRAQDLLDSHTWSEVVRIDNSAASSPYPRVVPALIFQLDSVLWFYTPTDGTQSLSRLLRHAEADKLDVGPLLAAIDKGFTRWTVLPRVSVPAPARGRIPNGCFIESIALLFQRMSYGIHIENPKLLSYYVSLPGGVRGHTVLQYTAAGRIQVVDPDRPKSTLRVRANEDVPKSVADRIRGDVASARHLPLGEFLDRAPGRFYATVPANNNGNYESQTTNSAELSRITRS